MYSGKKGEHFLKCGKTVASSQKEILTEETKSDLNWFIARDYVLVAQTNTNLFFFCWQLGTSASDFLNRI